MYNLLKNNCTTFVTDFIKKYNIEPSLYDENIDKHVLEKIPLFTGGTPGTLGYHIYKDYPLTNVKKDSMVLKDLTPHDVYYSEMSQRLSINTDKSLGNDYVSMTDKFMEYNGHYYGVIKVKNKNYRYKTEWDKQRLQQRS